MGETSHVAVTVVATVLNEGTAVDALVESLLAGTRRPDAVVVVDGGSTDDTLARLGKYCDRGVPMTVLSLPGSNISQGRNAAIARAVTEWVAVVDAGVRLAPHWLAELMAPVEKAPASVQPEAVAGFFEADPCTLFEAALAATTLPRAEEIDLSTFLPSSRSFACTRQVWSEIGGYPEWLDYGEDLVFDLRLKALGVRFAWAPEAIAHFRPRPTAGAYWRQYYRYARGDGKANLWPGRHAVRYGTYAMSLAAIVLATHSRRARAPVVLLLALGTAAYLRKPMRRLVALGLPPRQLGVALCLLPFLRALGDAAKMCGYPVGRVWRLRHRPVDWRSQRP